MTYFDYPTLPLADGVATGETTLVPGNPTADNPSALVNAIASGTYRYEMDGNLYSVTLPDMRSAGSIADTWNVATGEFTQKIGVKVLNGTEVCSTYYNVNFVLPGLLGSSVIGSVSGGISSHFTVYSAATAGYITEGRIGWQPQGNLFVGAYTKFEGDIAAFKSWLAAQYSAGTPVTVYYQLAAPVTSTINQTMVWDAPVIDRVLRDVLDKTAKGYYNAADLNRVGLNVRFLAEQLAALGYHALVEPKTDWTMTDFPTEAAMQTYLGNMVKLVDAFMTLAGTPSLPESMNNLDWQKANNIEQNLADIKEVMEWLMAGFHRAGTFCAGEGSVVLPT